MKLVASLAGILVVVSALPQDTKPGSAREMYFGGLEDAELVPGKLPVSQTKGSSVKRRTPARNRNVLGLRYSIMKLQGAEKLEVPRNTVFRSGDRIQIKIRPNKNGYMYVVHQGTSGGWVPLFPNPKRDHGSNRVEAGKDYLLPPDQALRFSGAPGVERLFVVITRVPESSLDSVIYRVQEGSRPPSDRPPEPDKMLLASNATVADPVIDHLRSAQTRDLVFDDIEEAATASREVATYVVNTRPATDARVVADIELTHQ